MKLRVAALLLLIGRAALADDAPPAPRPATWYVGWSLIVAGGAASLTGAALTTRNDTDDAGAPVSGLSSSQTAGWVLVAVGAAVWICGAVTLLITERRARLRAHSAFDWRAAAIRF